jgi:hypothetical protein
MLFFLRIPLTGEVLVNSMSHVVGPLWSGNYGLVPIVIIIIIIIIVMMIIIK